MLRSRHAGLTGSLRISCTLHTSPFNSPWTRRTSWSTRACRQSGEGPERYSGSEHGAPLVRDRRDGRDDDDARVCGLAQEGDQSRREKVHAVDVDCGQALGRAGWTCPCGVAGHATRRHGGQYRLHGTAPSHAPRLVTSQSSLPLARTALEAKPATHSSTPSHTSFSTASAGIRFVSSKQRQRRTVQVICDRVLPRLLYRRVVDHDVDLHSARALDRRMIACPGTLEQVDRD